MVRVEIENVIVIPADSSEDVLRGVALVASMIQREGITARYKFGSAEKSWEFAEISAGYFSGDCRALGVVGTMEGAK